MLSSASTITAEAAPAASTTETVTMTTQTPLMQTTNKSDISPLKVSSTISLLDEVEIDADTEADADIDVIVDVDSVATKTSHFLDYDAAAPSSDPVVIDNIVNLPNSDKQTTEESSNLENFNAKQYHHTTNSSEHNSPDSLDQDLVGSGYSKNEFTQDDNTLSSVSIIGQERKESLNENLILSSCMLNSDSRKQMREHRSLDRNFERHNEQRLLALPLGVRSSRDRLKESSTFGLLKGISWTQSFDSRHYYYGTQTEKLDKLGSKVECVYSLLSMLGSNDPLEMAKKFCELSRSPETCITLRKSGCIPLLVQMLHADGSIDEVRKWAGMALHNVVHSHPDEKSGRREAKVLRLLDQIMDYCIFLRSLLQSGGEAIADDADRHPLAAISSLMKVSFDEEHRHSMCELGALQAIPNLVHLDHAVHGPRPEHQCCNSLRRFALMALTNLTFGDENNKALLCSQKVFMEALVAQLDSAPDDLLQVTASVLRNLSWRADSQMKAVLNEIGTVTSLAKAAMNNKCENTLKAILSALWNLSAHCSTNKAEFCAVEGSLSFIVQMLTYEGPSKTLKIIENAGGILRNVSSHIAVREDYRKILRQHNCLAILLQQLKSESLTVVSNSCGTLWNLSARCPEDQRFLWDNGAVPMLRSLIHSKHAMIAEGSASALKNLLHFRPSMQNTNQSDPITRSLNLKKLPSLNVRKQKALEQEFSIASKSHHSKINNAIQRNNGKDLATYDSTATTSKYIQGNHSTGNKSLAIAPAVSGRLTRSAMLSKSESGDSIFTSKSDTAIYEQFIRSHSASDTNRKYQAIPAKRTTKTYALNGDRDEQTEEKPIDYSVKYNENVNATANHKLNERNKVTKNTTYQETDLDQLTDFSLRYAEKHSESEIVSNSNPLNHTTKQPRQMKEESEENITKSDNEIVLILEDTVKCYKTEDTPYIISNAGSTTDVRLSTVTSAKIEAPDLCPNAVQPPTLSTSTIAEAPIANRKSNKLQEKSSINGSVYATGSGAYTPEKPINYCEEGTPGYFSRYDSLNSLDEAPNHLQANVKEPIHEERNREKHIKVDTNLPKGHPSNADEGMVTSELQVNSALETPLMFSRYSSLDSLAEEDVCPIDDKSSVVSEFSRLASGIISPSEIPDSPSQSMPHSPKGRRCNLDAQPTSNYTSNASAIGESSRLNCHSKSCVKSVFEDNLNTFHVENTPAQISSATSLSNLSIADDEPTLQSVGSMNKQSLTAFDRIISEEEEEEEEEDANCESTNDDALLASCINMGMNRLSTSNLCKTETKQAMLNTEVIQDETTNFYTEDTPALLSKVCSNTNLSALSIYSNGRDGTDDNIYEVVRRTKPSPTSTTSNSNVQTAARHSLNFSDDMSSNASESGAVSANFDILQQCIRDGMQRSSKVNATDKRENELMLNIDPIDMLRSGGNVLPRYLPVNDEVNKYLIEDSPCNFSTTSGLSNLTVGSSLVGPALQLNGKFHQSNKEIGTNVMKSNGEKNIRSLEGDPSPSLNSTLAEGVCNGSQWHDDSLSSLSIDSEDDTNLLSQAIAAGCKRPSTNSMFTTSLASSQPISIDPTTSLSHLQTANTVNKTMLDYQNNSNESYSSIDSSDSNDNQSKSLLELCILKGMHKTQDTNRFNNADVDISSSTHTNPFARSAHIGQHKSSESAGIQPQMNIKQFDSLPLKGVQLSTNRHLRELEMRDERLLMECINTGIMTKIGETPKTKQMIMSTNQPKNLQATSAAASTEEPYRPISATITTAIHQMTNNNKAAPDVETIENINSTTTPTISSFQSNLNITHANVTDDQERAKLENQIAISEAAHQNHAIDSEIMNAIGYNANNCKSPLTCDSKSNQSDESNESFIFETTVSFENSNLEQLNTTNYTASDKHKDPDLMLKSVERLTMEFVSSAEQLRLQNGHHASADVCQINNAFSPSTQSLISVLHEDYVNKEHSTGAAPTNNTWNEDTCPNDVSFPSISVTVPKGVSLSYEDNYDSDFDNFDHTIDDFKELNDISENIAYSNKALLDLNLCTDDQPFTKSSQPNSLEPYTEIETTLKDASISNTIEKNSENLLPNGLHFKLGGKVQSAAMVPSLLCSMNPLTNSGFIAAEAHKLAINLEKATNNDDEMSFSNTSLDLDNIRPPSGMDSLNISGYYQESSLDVGNIAQPHSLQRIYMGTQSPQLSAKSPKFARKSLPSGLVARRALGQLPPHIAGSMDSITSSCNIMLDNIKPPSLMDELLDSMISVASIQSEIAEDCPSMATTVSISNYETAGNNNTLTMQSCCHNLTHDDDLTYSEGNITPLPSDIEYSSVDSTPQKSQNADASPKGSLTPKEKRKLTKDRFKTYTIVSDLPVNTTEQQDEHISENFLQKEINQNSNTGDNFCNTGNQQTPRGRRRTSHDRYKTQTIVYSTSSLHSSELSNSNTSEKLNSTLHNMNANHNESDLTSFEYEQHSGTESSYDLNVTTISDNEHELKHVDLPKTQTLLPISQNPPITNGKPLNGNIQGSHASPYGKSHLRNNNPETKYNLRVTKSNTNAKLNSKTIPYANNFSKNAVIRKRNVELIPTDGNTYKKQTQKKNLQQISPTSETKSNRQLPNTLERQGTFTKDEPSVDAAVIPIVVDDSIQHNKFKASKLPTTRQSSIATRKVTTAPTNGRRLSSYSASPQRANTTVNMKRSSNIYTKRISSTTPPTRSNSTLNNTVNANVSANSTSRLQQSQSRVANIWRNTNEARSKQASSRLINTSNNMKGKSPQTTTFKYLNSNSNGNNSKSRVATTPTGRPNNTTKAATTNKRW